MRAAQLLLRCVLIPTTAWEIAEDVLYVLERTNLALAHKRVSSKTSQTGSMLVARRSKRPAYPANTFCGFWPAPKKAIKTRTSSPLITEYVTQTRQRGSLAKRHAMAKKPHAIAPAISYAVFFLKKTKKVCVVRT